MIGAIEWRQWRQWRQSNGANGANGAKRRPMAPGLFLLGKRMLFDASSPDPPVVLRHSDVASMDPVDATWHLHWIIWVIDIWIISTHLMYFLP